MNPADKRLSDLIDKWLTSLELHLKYSALDDASYWKVQPWVKHERPSRWIIELARQKALQLKEQVDSRIAMGDAKFSDALELMSFLANLVGAQHIERFIPIAQPQNEINLSPVPPAPAPRAAAPGPDTTQQSALVTQPQRTIAPDATREMPRPQVAARPAPMQKTEARKGATRREGKAGANAGSAAKAKAEQRATSAEREQAVVADAVRLLGWGRKWHELAELITRMADRPPISEVRRILRDEKQVIEQQLGRSSE